MTELEFVVYFIWFCIIVRVNRTWTIPYRESIFVLSSDKGLRLRKVIYFFTFRWFYGYQKYVEMISLFIITAYF